MISWGKRLLFTLIGRAVGNLVFGAIVKPQEAGYGDQEGHVGRAFVGRDPKEMFGLFDELKKALGRARLDANTLSHSVRLPLPVIDGSAFHS